jgi:glycosyltransferase involved in cell wall biosynthesis
MKKIVVVNDCAYVMSDLIPYLTDSYKIHFLPRSRNTYSKTLGIFLKVLATSGDLYHVNYALQDAYLVSKLKRRLDVLHVHGSDVRTTLNTKWGWIVKHNLLKARTVLFSTEDLAPIVNDFRPDAAYLPNPVDTLRFKFKNTFNDPPKALYFKLNYETIPPILPKLLDKHGISLDILDRNIPYNEMPNLLSAYDVFVDRFTIKSLSKTCLESMSVGLATVDYRHVDDFERRVEELSEPENIIKIGKENRNFILKNHDVRLVAERLKKVYARLL